MNMPETKIKGKRTNAASIMMFAGVLAPGDESSTPRDEKQMLPRTNAMKIRTTSVIAIGIRKMPATPTMVLDHVHKVLGQIGASAAQQFDEPEVLAVSAVGDVEVVIS